jgi:hypothetical protein
MAYSKDFAEKSDKDSFNKLNKAFEDAVKGNINFIAYAGDDLKKIIINNVHPNIIDLPDKVKAVFLENKAYVLHPWMIKRYIEGRLDEKNTFILNLCDIRVIGTDIIKVAGEDHGKERYKLK